MKNIVYAPDAAEAAGSPPAAAATGIPQEQHIALLEKARKEEKNKVNDRMTSLEQEVARLNGIVAEKDKELAAVTGQLTEATTALEAIKKAKTTSGDVDVKALVEEISKSAAREFAKKNKEQIEAAEARIAQMENENKQFRLAKAKEDAIAAVGGRGVVIEKLITGNTPEELLASAKESAELYRTIRGESATTTTQNTSEANTSGSQQQNPPQVPSSGSNAGAGRLPTGGTGSALINSVKSMTTKEFAERREQLKQEAMAQSRYASNSMTARR